MVPTERGDPVVHELLARDQDILLPEWVRGRDANARELRGVRRVPARHQLGMIGPAVVVAHGESVTGRAGLRGLHHADERCDGDTELLAGLDRVIKKPGLLQLNSSLQP